MEAKHTQWTVDMPYIGPLFVGKTPRPVTVSVGRYRSQWAVRQVTPSFAIPTVMSVHKTKSDAVSAAKNLVCRLKARKDKATGRAA